MYSNSSLDRRIIKFVQRHHVLTLATVDSEGKPYCSNAFYGYDEERNAFVFASNMETKHVQQMIQRHSVAASILLESKIVGKLQGLQISGDVFEGDEQDRKCYIAAFPFAALAPTPLTLWRLEPHFLKYTDNKLGFGTKLIWNK